MIPIMNLVTMLINRNPQMVNNPRAQQLLSVIQNGSAEQGQRIAENLCATYGVSKEQALTDAKNFFGLR